MVVSASSTRLVGRTSAASGLSTALLLAILTALLALFAALLSCLPVLLSLLAALLALLAALLALVLALLTIRGLVPAMPAALAVTVALAPGPVSAPARLVASVSSTHFFLLVLSTARAQQPKLYPITDRRNPRGVVSVSRRRGSRGYNRL